MLDLIKKLNCIHTKFRAQALAALGGGRMEHVVDGETSKTSLPTERKASDTFALSWVGEPGEGREEN